MAARLPFKPCCDGVPSIAGCETNPSNDVTCGGAVFGIGSQLTLCEMALKESSAAYGGGGWFGSGNVELFDVLVANITNAPLFVDEARGNLQ